LQLGRSPVLLRLPECTRRGREITRRDVIALMTEQQ
jgi:hypothetical protein